MLREAGYTTGKTAFTHQNIPRYCIYVTITNEITVYAITDRICKVVDVEKKVFELIRNKIDQCLQCVGSAP